MKKIYTSLLILFAGAVIAQNSLKPAALTQDQNLQIKYPTVPNNKTSGCWSGVDATYIDMTPLFTGSYAALDDGSYGPISLPFTFTFYGQTYTSIYVNVNGNITFGSAYSSYSASGFPASSVPAMIAPFWGDVDLRGVGQATNKVYYKLESNKITIIWTGVGFYNRKTNLLNTFKVVLTDGTDSSIGVGYNARFSYDDMNWGVGDAGGGNNGFGTSGSFASVGAQSQGGTYYYQIGLFGKDNTDFDGAGGDIDGVQYLDGQCFTMDLSAINIPPVAIDFPSSSTLSICSGSTFTLSTGFTGPESNQNVTTTVTNSTLNNFSATVTNGNYSTADISIVASILDTGTTHTVTYQAIDNGSIPDTTTISIDFNVYDCGQFVGPSALYFDGVDDYISTLNNASYNPTGSITLEAWVRPTSSQSGESPVVYKQDQYSLYLDGSSNTPEIKLFIGGGWNTLSSNVNLTADEWSHISATYDGVDLKIYVNGDLKNSSSLTGSVGTSSNDLIIGGDGTSAFYNGRIDDVRIWDVARNLSDIDEMRYSDLVPSSVGSSLKAMFKINEEAGGVVVDSVNITNGTLTNMDLNTVWKPNYSKRWEGSVDSDYDKAANWSKNLLPLAQDNGSIEATQIVVIPDDATTELDFNTTAQVNNLVICGNASPNFRENSSITIYEDLSNYGTPTYNGKVTLSGSSTQYLKGSNSFNNLDIDADVTMMSDQDVWGTLALNTGDLNVNGNVLTIKSDSSKTGAVFHNSGSITGNTTIERFIDQSSPNWFGYHYLSSPMANQTLAAIDDDITLVSLGGNTSSVPFPNIWYYDETVVSSNFLDGWIVPNATTDDMVPMKGYALSNYNDFTLDFTGVLNNGNYSIPVTSTSSGNVDADGWNFVGNPYPSPIDWGSVTLPSGIDNAAYYWDEEKVQYASYINGVGINGGTRFISSAQGFYIHATSAATLSLTNAVRTVESSNGVFWRSSGGVNFPKTLKLEVSGQGYQDEIAVRFSSQSTLNFDSEYDAYKLSSGDPNAPMFYTMVNGDKLSINSLDSLNGTRSEQLYFQTQLPGNYQIEMSLKGDFSSEYTVEIEDTKTGTFHDITTGAYSFQFDGADGNNRFVLHFNHIPLAINEIEDFSSINVYSYHNKILVSGLKNEDAQVLVYDLFGREITTTNLYNNHSKEIMMPQASEGYYIVKLNVNNNVITKKVFIQQLKQD